MIDSEEHLSVIFTAAESERLRSWAADIAAALLPPGTRRCDTGTSVRFGNKGSLAINRLDGGWYDHSAGHGGLATVSLIRHLLDCASSDALIWARSWLTQHSGTGACCVVNGEIAEAVEIAAQVYAEYANDVLENAVPVEGTPAETYLRSRGCVGPYPDCVRYLPNARPGEGALVGVLSVAYDVVGLQLGYIDPDGRKSTVEPKRRTYYTDRQRGPRGVFRLMSDDAYSAMAETVETVVVEGLENGLSLAQAAVSSDVRAVPGVGRFRHLEFSAGHHIVVFRDGDASDSPADRALTEGVDHLLLRGAVVRVTETPSADDANRLLQVGGPEILRRLVADAPFAELSPDGEVRRLAALPDLVYERERTRMAKKLSIRVGLLDRAVQRMRPVPERASQDGSGLVTSDVPWAGGEVDLRAVLDAALAEVAKYVVAEEMQLAAAILWCAHAHLVHNDAVGLHVSPRLAIQAPDIGCGKTTMLEVIGCLSPRALLASSISTAAIFRTLQAHRPTLLIDEADRVIRSGNDDMMAVLNSSHRRHSAFVFRTEETADGTWKTVKFSTWGATAYAGIGRLPDTLQDRSIIATLRKAMPGELRDHLRDGSSPTLVALRRQMGSWAETLIALPEPQMPPTLYNRAGDNWFPLFAIAEMAGGQWPTLIRSAAEAAVARNARTGRVTVLLRCVRSAFGGRPRMTSHELIGALLTDPEEDWDVANKGKVITAAWLRENFDGLLQPAGTHRWKENGKDCRGYLREQFEDSWRRYLSDAASQPASGDDLRESAADAHQVAPAVANEDTVQKNPMHADDTSAAKGTIPTSATALDCHTLYGEDVI